MEHTTTALREVLCSSSVSRWGEKHVHQPCAQAAHDRALIGSTSYQPNLAGVHVFSDEDIEREVYGASSSLCAAERLLWRRWVTHENHRLERQSRMLCAGRPQPMLHSCASQIRSQGGEIMFVTRGA